MFSSDLKKVGDIKSNPCKYIQKEAQKLSRDFYVNLSSKSKDMNTMMYDPWNLNHGTGRKGKKNRS